MPVFVHLTLHSNVASIRRGGIGLRKRRFRPRGVYAMPVTRNYYVSHQWLRELRRHGGGTIVAVYFRVPDDEPGRWALQQPVRRHDPRRIRRAAAGSETREPAPSARGRQSKAIRRRTDPRVARGLGWLPRRSARESSA